MIDGDSITRLNPSQAIPPLTSCVHLSSLWQVLSPGEAAARSPPLFWSLVWAAQQGEIAGALSSGASGGGGVAAGGGAESESVLCLASAFEAVVAEADSDRTDD